MIKAFIILIIFTVIILSVCILLIRQCNKLKKELKAIRIINDNYTNAASKVEENIKKANNEKKKLNTGNPVTDVNNATDIMSDIANKRSKN